MSNRPFSYRPVKKFMFNFHKRTPTFSQFYESLWEFHFAKFYPQVMGKFNKSEYDTSSLFYP